MRDYIVGLMRELMGKNNGEFGNGKQMEMGKKSQPWLCSVSEPYSNFLHSNPTIFFIHKGGLSNLDF